MYWAHHIKPDVAPSLVNEVCLVSARHPGDSLPVNLPPEAAPDLTNGSPLPSQPWFFPLSMCIKAEVQLVTSHFDVHQGSFSIHSDVWT